MKYKDQDAVLKNWTQPGTPERTWTDQLLAALGGSEQKVGADFKLPYILSFGAAYQFNEQLRGEVDYVRFGWSHFDALEIDFVNPAMRDEAIRFNYENTWQIRFGLDYVAIPGKLNVMAGYVHDNTPQPLASVSPLLPDSDRNDYSLGVKYKHNQWDVTLSYMAVIPEERTTIENGGSGQSRSRLPRGHVQVSGQHLTASASAITSRRRCR